MSEQTVIDPCVECGESTAPGFGRWVNRLPTDGGFQCIECLGSVFECDRCGEDIPFDEDQIVEAILGVECDADNLNNPRSAEGVRVGPCCAPTDEWQFNADYNELSRQDAGERADIEAGLV